MKLYKIVLTGGPCAGKTTAIEEIKKYFEAKGTTVLVIPETATELINSGISPATCKNNLEFQTGLMKLQLEKERVYMRAASGMKGNKIIILCDRGGMDNKAYMGSEDFCRVLFELKESEPHLRESYDAVFHLVTAANGARSFYTKKNNTARRESPEQAVKIDNSIISAWVGHSHLRIIDNSTGFNQKLKRLIAEINAFIGDPEPFEIERKYLIRFPDLDRLNSDPFCRRTELSQSYISYPDGRYFRVRRRGSDGEYTYIKTFKRKVSDMRRIEIEESLTREQYESCLLDSDASICSIEKDRYCFVYNSQYFELDVFPFWNDRAFLEIELTDENQSVSLPPFVEVIRDVTTDDRYKNYSMAQTLSRGEIPD